MANFFDQFDAVTPQAAPQASANFFDQFDGQPKVGVAEDIAKSIPSGLASGGIGLAGMAGDIQNLGSGLDLSPWLAKKAQEYFPNATQFLRDESAKTIAGDSLGLANKSADALNIKYPTSGELQSAVEEKTGPLYKPQTVPGEYAKTGAEFIPSMVLGGEGSIVRQFLTNVAAPAIVSETAGQLTKGTAAEPYARAGGALLGGGGASKIANGMAERSALKAATPSLADVKNEASSAYDALTSRNVAIPIQTSALDNLANDIQSSLNSKGIRPSTAKGIHDAIDEIRTPATKGAADVADLVAARQSVKNLLSSPDASKVGAFIALPKIEAAIERASPGTMASIKEADKNWASFKAGEALDKRTARAELRAAGEHSGTNVGNKIRQQVTNYLLSNEAKFLPAETKAELEKIVRGTWTQNGMRAAANLMGGGGGLGMLAGGTAGYQAGGAPGAIAGMVAGRGFKIANNRSVVKQAEQAAESIRRRSPLGQQSLPALPASQNPAVQGLLSMLLARPQQ